MAQCPTDNTRYVGDVIAFRVQPLTPTGLTFTGRIYIRRPGAISDTLIKTWTGLVANGWSLDYLYTTLAADIGSTIFKARIEYSKTGCTNPIVSAIKQCTFVISSPPTNSIRVTSPNGGENWVIGTSHNITWAKTGNTGANVEIELLKGATPSTITTSTPNDGTYAWAIPATTATCTNCKIRITSTSNTAYTDTSNANFTISSGVVPKWKCSGSPNYTCSRDDVNGTYLSQTACQSACRAPIISDGTTEEADNTWLYIIAGIVLLYILAEG